jgi:ABC-type polysaccharide transport system permease subunit
MVSSGLLRRVALVRTTRRINPEDTILQIHNNFTVLYSVTFLVHFHSTNLQLAVLFGTQARRTLDRTLNRIAYLIDYLRTTVLLWPGFQINYYESIELLCHE